MNEFINKRLHRQGQTEKVIVHHLVVEGRIDEDMLASLGDNGATQDKQIETNLHILELINENIRLYQDNIKLNHELKRLRKRLEVQEDIDLARLEMLMGIEDSNSVVILMVKNSGEFIN